MLFTDFLVGYPKRQNYADFLKRVFFRICDTCKARIILIFTQILVGKILPIVKTTFLCRNHKSSELQRKLIKTWNFNVGPGPGPAGL